MRALTITAIISVAVIMGIIAIVPVLPQAMANHNGSGFTCPPNSPGISWGHQAFGGTAGDPPDRNGNGFVCVASLVNPSIIIDDIPNPRAARG